MRIPVRGYLVITLFGGGPISCEWSGIIFPLLPIGIVSDKIALSAIQPSPLTNCERYEQPTLPLLIETAR